MPVIYKTHESEKIEKVFADHKVDQSIVDQLYILYYRDFLYFNYSIDSFVN